MKKLLITVVLLVAGYLIWTQWRSGQVRSEELTASADAPVSAEIARQADRKLQDLKNQQAELVALRANELQSLLQFRFLQLLPAFVYAPQIELQDGQIELRARIPVERLPTLNELGEAAAFLPDTTDVDLVGTLLPLDSGRVAFAIQQVRAARIPLPQRLVPGALQRLGRKDEPGLPRDALALPLPPGASAAYVHGDSLVLLARPNRRSNP
ncbi:MAG: hypothetical protein ACRENP_07090 [Longimicrobiales bacterium]